MIFDYSKSNQKYHRMDYTRILHFMWIDPSQPDVAEPPESVPSFIDAWRETHPSWQIMFWNLSRCEQLFKSTPELAELHACVFGSEWLSSADECSHPRLHTLYTCGLRGLLLEKNTAMHTRMSIADTCRLAVVYAYGGVYLDLSMNPLAGLDQAWIDYPERETLYCWEPTFTNVVLNSLIGARRPKLAFWLKYLKHICATKDQRRLPYDLFIHDPRMVTGPYALAEYVRANPQLEQPLACAAFARRQISGEISKKCGTGANYAEKIWRLSSNWGDTTAPQPASLESSPFAYLCRRYGLRAGLGISVVVLIIGVILYSRRTPKSHAQGLKNNME
jgi:mannosyltransferase OCH1-like enzyme